MNDAVVADPPRKRSWLPKLLIALAVVVVGIAACTGAVAYFVVDANSDVGEVEDTIESFLGATSKDDTQAAYALFSSEITQDLTPAAFSSSVKTNAAYHDYEKLKRSGWEKHFATGEPTYFSYQGVVTYTDGKTRNLEAEVLKEDGKWKIRFIQVSTAGSPAP